jgi:hypothetical protein
VCGGGGVNRVLAVCLDCCTVLARRPPCSVAVSLLLYMIWCCTVDPCRCATAVLARHAGLRAALAAAASAAYS